MHPFSILTLLIFVAGYITARWDLVTRLYELALFTWYHDVLFRATRGFVALSVFFGIFVIPFIVLAVRETDLHPRSVEGGLSAREQLRRRGSF